jgi:protein SCO1/2
MQKTHIILFGIAILVGLIAVVGAFFLTGPYAYQGSLIDPPVQAKDFSLIDQNGGTFRLSDQQGKVLMIFFGYTNCPDECPATLAEFKGLISQLGDAAQQVRFVFITVDPERDTQERLQEYLANFDPSIIGLTGNLTDLKKVWNDYGIYQEEILSEDTSNYSVGHTNRIYAIDVHGNLRLTYPFGIDQDKILQDLVHLSREN